MLIRLILKLHYSVFTVNHFALKYWERNGLNLQFGISNNLTIIIMKTKPIWPVNRANITTKLGLTNIVYVNNISTNNNNNVIFIFLFL